MSTWLSVKHGEEGMKTLPWKVNALVAFIFKVFKNSILKLSEYLRNQHNIKKSLHTLIKNHKVESM